MRVEDRETSKLFRKNSPVATCPPAYALLDHDLEGQVRSKWSLSSSDHKFHGMVSMILYLLVFMQCGRLFIGMVGQTADTALDLCPQVSSIYPSKHVALLEELEHDFLNETYRLAAYESLGGAVRIPTEMFDNLKPPGQDPRWDVFADMHKYLEQRFPLVHSKLHKSTINMYALVFHWQGTDDSLKPILMAAHQDVVPVPESTLKDWVHPPFSGLYDGKWIWGRGSCDDKSGLIGNLIAVESLLEKGFTPTRSVVLAYGIDEERGGVSGATAIRDFLLSSYGEDAFSLLIDEGGKYVEKDGFVLSTPATAEKGKFDARIEVATRGGHSSVPPPHTSIGILASIIAELEANPHPTNLNRSSTYFKSLQCRAQHDPDMAPIIRKLVKKSASHDSALRKLEELMSWSWRYKAETGTTQAVDMIGGGVKTNALPESAWAVVNHRIGESSSVQELQTRMSGLLAPLAERFNLSLSAFGNSTSGDNAGSLILSDAFGTALNPSPITPTFGSGPWELLSGTIISTIKSSIRPGYVEGPVVVSPSLGLGNTDTKFYWKLTKHIFRYGHRASSDMFNGGHTINEAMKAEGFIEEIRFFVRLILNADESSLLD